MRSLVRQKNQETSVRLMTRLVRGGSAVMMADLAADDSADAPPTLQGWLTVQGLGAAADGVLGADARCWCELCGTDLLVCEAEGAEAAATVHFDDAAIAEAEGDGQHVELVVGLGLGRIIALCYRSSTLCQIH
jgi:hypothetical protein